MDRTSSERRRLPWTGTTRRAVLAAPASGGLVAVLAACAMPGTGVPTAKIKPGTRLVLYDGIPDDADRPSPKRDLLATFTAKTGATVEEHPRPEGVWYEQLLVQAAAGTGPDVAVGGGQMSLFVERGVIADISARVARGVPKSDIADWVPTHYAWFQRAGAQYGLPKYCGTLVGTMNTDLFRQQGLPQPGETTRWEQLLGHLTQLTRKDDDRYLQFGLDRGVLTSLAFGLSWFVWSWGGEVTDPKDDSKCLLDQPAALAALQFVQDLIWRHHVVPQPADSAAFGPGSDLIARGMAATNFNLVQQLNVWRTQNPALKCRFFANPLGPTGKRATWHTVDGYGIFSNTKELDAAWELLRFVTSPDWGRMLIQWRQLQPARRSLAADWANTVRQNVPEARDADLEAYTRAFDYARAQVSFSNNTVANDLLNPVIGAVYTRNEMSASVAFKEAAPRVTAALQAAKR